MLTDKEKKFIETQKKYSKLFLIIPVLILSLAILLFFMIINFPFNLTEICGACKIPPELRTYLLGEQFRCVLKFSAIRNFAGGLLIGFLLCLIFSFVNYMSSKKCCVL